MRVSRNLQGFTLIEMMVVLALLAIFATIGIPAYENITTTNRMAAEMNEIVRDIQFARSTAIETGTQTDICPANAAIASATDPACLATTSTNWSNGWSVYAYGTTHVYRIHAAIQDYLSSNTQGPISFNRNGFTTQAATIQMTLNNAQNNTNDRNCLTLTTVGNLSTQSGSNCP